MKTVSVSELKAHLSRFLREVRRGSEIQVLDRGVPVARLVPLPPSGAGADEGHRRRLIGSGLVRGGTGEVSKILETEPLELPVSLVDALSEEREDRF